MVQYLYNSDGEWIAFRDGSYVYDTSGAFLGFMAEDDVNVANIENRYFATIYPDNRLYRKLYAPEIDARFPGYPGLHPRPDIPEFGRRAVVPMEADDIPELTAA